MLNALPVVKRNAHWGPLRVAVLCSHRAPGLMYLLNRSPDRGVSFDIVCVVTSEHTFDEEVRVERRGIPVLVHPIGEFCAARHASLYNDAAVRAEYDAGTVKLVEPYFPDVILLGGYLYLVTGPLLRAFPDRILNLHFSDLTLRTADGRPRFPGLRAVRAALAAGCPETRATVHLVDEEPDAGPPVVVSWPFPSSTLVDDARTLDAPESFRAYVYAHQQWMMQTASGPLLAAALRLFAADAIGTQPWRLDRDGSLMEPASALFEPDCTTV